MRKIRKMRIIDVSERYLDRAKYHKGKLNKKLSDKENRHHEKMYKFYLHLANKEDSNDKR